MLPKKNVFLKYVKSSRKKSNEKVLQHIADHYTISLGEAEDYIYILKKEGVEMILERAGVDAKEIKKLLKEVQ
jgi:F420-0:gamma-glutamyl ligase